MKQNPTLHPALFLAATFLAALGLGTPALAEVDTAPKGTVCEPSAVRPDDAWAAQYRVRADRLINSRQWAVGTAGFGDTDAGKRAWPMLLANLYKAKTPEAQKAIIAADGKTCINQQYTGTFYKPFSAPGYTQYYFQFKDLLPADQKARALQMTMGEGWQQMSRNDGQMDPIYKASEFNSENFCWMARLARFLWAHEAKNPARIKTATEFVDNWVRGTFCTGRVEWDSVNYFGYSLQPVLVLADWAQTPKAKAQALAVADWMSITMALHCIDGNLVGPDVRAKGGAYEKYAGSAWPWAYTWFTDATFRFSYTDAQMAQQAPNQMLGTLAYSKYRPPQVAIDIAQRKFKAPIEMHNTKPYYHLDFDDYRYWKGDKPQSRRFEFETLYLEKDYTLGSLATHRPDGAIGHFSEQRVWGLGVKSDSEGPHQVFGNAGKMTGLAGRCPFEEIGQYRNVMMRLVKGVDNIWVALPASIKTDRAGDLLLADMGHDTYAAWKPIGLGAMAEPQAFGGKKKDAPATHTKYSWAADMGQLGALVLEVGTKREHGSYAKFCEAMASKAKLTREGDSATYQSTLGLSLKCQFMPPQPYKQHIGDTIEAGGVPPKVWCDGKPVDFETWNSYEVVFGEKIVEQAWSSGVLTAQCEGKGLQIRVGLDDAKVEYRKLP